MWHASARIASPKHAQTTYTKKFRKPDTLSSLSKVRAASYRGRMTSPDCTYLAYLAQLCKHICAHETPENPAKPGLEKGIYKKRDNQGHRHPASCILRKPCVARQSHSKLTFSKVLRLHNICAANMSNPANKGCTHPQHVLHVRRLPVSQVKMSTLPATRHTSNEVKLCPTLPDELAREKSSSQQPAFAHPAPLKLQCRTTSSQFQDRHVTLRCPVHQIHLTCTVCLVLGTRWVIIVLCFSGRQYRTRMIALCHTCPCC